MVLGENGIIGQTQSTKKAQESASDVEKVAIAKGEATIIDFQNQTGLKLDDPKMSTISNKISTYNVGKNSNEQYAYKNNIAKIIAEREEDKVPIPLGFAYVEGTTKENGLVIVDKDGNQFVWIPVDGENVQLLLDETYDGEEIGTEPSIVNGDSESGLKGDSDYNITIEQLQNEYRAMQNSVNIYGDFT